MNKESFIEELKKIGISINQDQYKQLENYYDLTIEYNKHTNLTRIIEKEDFFLKHYYDSLTINKIYKITNQKICDVGSGAGFPGIVLKIVFPETKITLIDSSNKRIAFLNKIISDLKLTDIKAIHSRIEEYNKEEEYDIITSRAVAKLNILLEISIKNLKVNGYFIAYKAHIEEELKQSQPAISKLSLKVAEIKEFNLPNTDEKRTLIKIIKQKRTSGKYPRMYKDIISKPL